MRRNPKSVYERFMNFEEDAAEIYVQMASRFSPENEALASLWLDMGMQEKQHAGLLQFCSAEEMYAPALPTDAEIQAAEELFFRLKKRVKDPDLSVNEAFHIAADLETSEVNEIYCKLTTPVHASMYLLRRKIVTSMPDHVGRLLQEGRKFGVPEATLKLLKQTHEKCPAA
jgi:rubrerythrin